MKSKENKFLEHPTVKLISIIILTLLLIMIALILFEDVGLDNSMLIYNIFGTLALVSFLYSFHTTSKKLYNDLCLGTTRKEFYIKYLKNIILVLFIALFFVAYYILSYWLIIPTNTPIFEIFDLKTLIYLPTLFLGLSFFGFLLGIIKLKRKFFYTIAGFITAMVVISLMYLTIRYLFTISLGVVVIGIGMFNYYLVRKIHI